MNQLKMTGKKDIVAGTTAIVNWVPLTEQINIINLIKCGSALACMGIGKVSGASLGTGIGYVLGGPAGGVIGFRMGTFGGKVLFGLGGYKLIDYIQNNVIKTSDVKIVENAQTKICARMEKEE